MKAVWYTRTGAADEVLELGEMPTPTPGEGEVLVRLAASGVNPSDVKLRAGKRAGGSGMPYPRIVPHSDGAGVIEAVGPGVDPARLGQRVWVWNGQWQRALGTAADAIAIAADKAVPLPDDVPFAVGAGLGIPAITASHCVLGDGPVEGQTVLVSGGGGVVGRLAVQFAKLDGAMVIATARPGAAADRAWSAGADAVLDHTAPDLAERILGANGGRPVDRIVEVEFGVNADTDAAVIKPRGRIVAYGSALDLRPEMPFYPLMFKGVNLELALMYLLDPFELEAAIGRVTAELTAGRLDVALHATYPLAACAVAHRAVEDPSRTGGVIVTLGD